MCIVAQVLTLLHTNFTLGPQNNGYSLSNITCPCEKWKELSEARFSILKFLSRSDTYQFYYILQSMKIGWSCHS